MPKLGSQLYLAIDAGPIHDEAGQLIAVVETLRDLTDQKRAEMALKELATKDGLTGLSNRRAFDQMLMSEWARAQRTQKPMALLFVDVDHFKLFNDRHGHQSGDECLRAVADVVSRHAVRPLDLASRYGGEEFALILPDMDCDAACAIAEEIRRAVMALRIAHGAVGAGDHVTLSVGVASHIPPRPTAARPAAGCSRRSALCGKTARPQPHHLLRTPACRIRLSRPGAGSWPHPAQIGLKRPARSGCPPPPIG
ncbi:GGDEF domain-containing protein [Bradyrhizobium japonicum]